MKHTPKQLRPKDEPGEAMQKGINGHLVMEWYLDGTIDDILTEEAWHKAFVGDDASPYVDMSKAKPIADWLKEPGGRLFIEDPIVYTKDYAALTYTKDWDNAWLRVKMDAMKINPEGDKAIVVDWKTGKRFVDEDQLALYAVAIFMHPEYAAINTVNAMYVWTKTGKSDNHVFHRSELAMLKMKFDDIIDQWEDARYWGNFPEKPGRACKFCVAKDICPYAEKS